MPTFHTSNNIRPKMEAKKEQDDAGDNVTYLFCILIFMAMISKSASGGNKHGSRKLDREYKKGKTSRKYHKKDSSKLYQKRR